METKKVHFCCPKHGVLNGTVEYFNVEIGSRTLVDMSVMYCCDCDVYYTPFGNFASFIKPQYKGKKVIATRGNAQKDAKREEVRAPHFVRNEDMSRDVGVTSVDVKTARCEYNTESRMLRKRKSDHYSYHKYVEVAEKNEPILPQQFPVYISNILLSKCPQCASELRAFTDYLPLSRVNKTYVRVPGKKCHLCNMVFDDSGEMLPTYLSERGDSIEGLLDMQYVIPNLAPILLDKKYLMFVYLKKCNSSEHRKIAIVQDIENQKTNDDVFHYAHMFLRKLLLDILEKNHKTIINNISYEILRIDYNILFNHGTLKNFDFFSPAIGLGLESTDLKYIKNKFCERYFLFYSPFKKAIVAEKTHYNPRTGEYLMTVRRFREIVYEYGNPNLKVYISRKNHKDGDYDYDFTGGIKEESLPHVWGYNVSSKENCSSVYRQKLLSELLDLGLLNKGYMYNWLQGLINTHKKEKYRNAVDKWQCDLEFIVDYKVDYDKFGQIRTF